MLFVVVNVAKHNHHNAKMTAAASMNLTNTDECLICSLFTLSTFFAFIFSAIVVVGVCGNIFVVSVILTDRKLLNSPINLFLLNLALADIGNLVSCCPDIAMFLYGTGWLLSPVLCPVLRFLEEYFLYASVLTQMSIGIERFMAICTPMRMQRFSRRTSALMIVSVWVTAAMFASPYLMFHRVFVRKAIAHCVWSPTLPAGTRVIFKYAECVVLYVLPLILLTVLYSIMSRVLWGNSTQIVNESQQAIVLALRRSVVKMLIISMLLYFICYSPIQGIFLTQIITKRDFQVSPAIRITLNALSFSSSSANPIVYIVCCRHFRSKFITTLRLICSIFPDSRRFSAASVEAADDATLRTPTHSSFYASFTKSFRTHLTRTATFV
ncbi:unnamed protein product [Anisakis simplex]|uniref:G_PROTEIN_RECEP_F1_2 domain-containing protein n=1 Tax=Anisakis simplex TaxID=6269 RepID=A0A0M3JVD9_ANISI|nr:unnamed protein product [Anisakis simplex]